MKELVVISGKGGTGKTSIAASLAVLSGRCVVADCDVDAADLHLILAPQVTDRYDFYSGHVAVIRQEACTSCGACLARCRFDAITRQLPGEDVGAIPYGTKYTCQTCDYCKRSCSARINDDIQAMSAAIGEARGGSISIDPIACEGCGVCVRSCPEQAIEFPERFCGEWFVSQTRRGPMVHARLGIAQSNSGKLVSIVRQKARAIAEQGGFELVIIDGSPGIGCPVIASITGASLVLIVTEPTLSGKHDMERVADLTRHFDTPALVCVNKWDLNPRLAEEIESLAVARNIGIAGRVRYDRAVTTSQIQGLSVVEYQQDGCAADLRDIWRQVRQLLETTKPQTGAAAQG